MTDGVSLRRASPQAAPPLRALTNSDVGVVAAKLSRPEVPAGSVQRPRLIAALDGATMHPVTLVTGGPGWGKTSLVAAWAAQASRSRTIAWLTLDADDDEPRVFWTYVLAALRASGAVLPGNPLASLAPVGGMSPDLLRQVQVGLSQLSREVVLVLDDVSEVRSPDVLDQITRLFRHDSPLRLVLVSRVEPQLPLHRLRVAGSLAEVRADELAFTPDEAAELLVHQGHGVDPAELAHLLDRTDGWAAGLRLAAMFLRREGARLADFGGSDRAVADYLLSEVVADQSPQTWQFLLRTSLVPRISGDLADSLTGQAHGQLTLERLERDNAFVTALGPERDWYRYHPLLSEMLRRQIRLERPESIPGLHERASRWFAANDQPIDAVRHAVAARNWALAGTMTTNVALHRLLTTDRHSLASALAQIPAAELGRSPELQLCAAAVSMVEGRLSEIAAHLARARSMLGDAGDGADPSTLVALNLFEALVARVSGSASGVVDAAGQALATLDEHGSAVPLASEFRAIALNNRGVGLLWQGRATEAAASLEAGLEAFESSGVELSKVNALGHLGLAAVVTGNLRTGVGWAQRCRDLAEARGWGGLPQAATGYLALALACVARNDLDEAEYLVAQGLDSQRDERELPTAVALRLTQAVIGIHRGQLAAAGSQLDEVHELRGTAELPPIVQQLLRSTTWESELASGQAAAVRSQLESIDPDKRSGTETLFLAKALLATGAAQGLDRMLAPVIEQRQDLRLAVRASVVHALAADRLRLDNDALDALGHAVAVAEPETMVSPFLGAGTERLRGLLERLVLLRPARSGFARRLLELHAPVPTIPQQAVSAEQMTEREQTVLRYLATMLSNAEIAEQMFLSPNTIKVHLRHVYRKLEVTSRRAAVRRARELQLLEDADGG
jgi:LuxR family maltose regulon positive regulatory protein